MTPGSNCGGPFVDETAVGSYVDRFVVPFKIGFAGCPGGERSSEGKRESQREDGEKENCGTFGDREHLVVNRGELESFNWFLEFHERECRPFIDLGKIFVRVCIFAETVST